MIQRRQHGEDRLHHIGHQRRRACSRFYDALLSELGASRAYGTDRLAAWRFGSEGTLLVLNAPYDKGVANAGNGTMVALKVADIQTVDLLHALALRLGAIDEGAPGPRGKGFYGAYFRDPDGNKLNLHCDSL